MNQRIFISAVVLFYLVGALVHAQSASAKDSYLVEQGKARAQIVIAEYAPRSTRLAARELQESIEKISGAKLHITSKLSSDFPVNIFVGDSEYAKQRGVTSTGLNAGAYRIVSGENWLVLIGDDKDFVPIEPWAKNNNGRAMLQARWEQASGLPYGVPNGGMYKNRKAMPEDLAKVKGEAFWGFDERGSYNAVCGFLRQLGVRWYMPGELGEIIPKTDSIPLPKIDQTTQPDFEVRQFNVRFGNSDKEIVRWAMRLGIRQVYGLQIAHGMHTMTHPDSLKADKPDWFALYGGKRDTEVGVRLNHLCYSNEELFQETVIWARAQFDVYDYQSVSIMPPDAYIAICQCPLCAEKQVEAMGSRGKLSNHVWDFANRVAKEVRKTHPDKLIMCLGYGANTEPPTNIEKLEPNVQVMIVGGRRPRNSLPEQREYVRSLQAGWLKKTSRPIMIFENYPFTSRGTYLPSFVAKTIGESINATKGVSSGEDIWLSFPRQHDDPNIGYDHFQVYFTARMWWGGKDADVDVMLKEYCDLFYGPAGASMKQFFDFCEPNYQAMETDLNKVEKALSIFEQAKSRVVPDSVYAKRVSLIDSFLERLRSKAKQLAQGRGPVTKLRTVWEPKQPIVIDGKLDDQYWVECPTSSRGTLRELQSGRQPIFGTTIKVGWDKSGQNLYFGIRCHERLGEKLNITTKDREDASIWYGDAIEIELETDAHRYYQLAINPAGAMVDLDRGADKSAMFRWESQAEVATQIEEDHWTVEIRIPVTEDENDPLNQVIGHKPSASLPWYFNICRQRIRKNGSEHSAFSPTGSAGFHKPLKFAHFYDGRSHSFEVDPTVTDFLIELNKAEKLMKSRKFDLALAAFLNLKDHEKATDLQVSRVLAKAVECARFNKDDEQAMELAKQISMPFIAMTAQMQVLLSQRDWDTIISQFGKENFQEWPFTEIGEAAFARGRAYNAVKQGTKAEADLSLALEFTSDSRIKMSILRTLAFNQELVLKQDTLALKTYRTILQSKLNNKSSEYFYALQGAARILTRQGHYDEALKVLNSIDAKKLPGSWSSSMLLSQAQTLTTAGQKNKALEIYHAILTNQTATTAQKKMVKELLSKVEH